MQSNISPLFSNTPIKSFGRFNCKRNTTIFFIVDVSFSRFAANIALTLFFLVGKFAGTTFCQQSQIHYIDAIKCDFSFEDPTTSTDQELIANVEKQGFQVRLEHETATKQTKHKQYGIFKDGIKVYRSFLKINFNAVNKPISSFRLIPLGSFIGRNTQIPSIKQSIESELKADVQSISQSIEKIWFPTSNDEILLANRYVIERQSDYLVEQIRAIDGTLLYEQSLVYNFTDDSFDIDTPATGFVFFPDPLTQSQNLYGGIWVDSSDGAIPNLESQKMIRSFNCSFQNDSFILKNEYVEMMNLGSPNYQVAKNKTGQFYYSRNETGFEDVNVYFHLSNFGNYVKEMLEFNNLLPNGVRADAHALNGADNSVFSPASNPPRILFGDGGVDDAEDADVIVHEYTHAISFSASPNTNNGIERTAIDEGTGDYFASSYSRSINEFGWERAYTWDGHNEFWSGRFTNSLDHYPEDLVENKYGDADIWSSVLMEIWADIGREITDKLVIQTLHGLASNMTMPQAAYLFLQADSILYNKEHFTPIRDRMVARGLLPFDVGITRYINQKLQAFYSLNTEEGRVEINGLIPKTPLLLCDITGRKILQTMVPESGKVSFSNTDLIGGGMFIVKNAEKSLKIVL